MIGNKSDSMAEKNANDEVVAFQSKLSFQPLIDSWRKKIKESEEGSSSLYEELLDRVSKHKELLEPITDLSILQKHQPLINIMMSTVFPVTLSDKEDLFAVAVPFTYHIVYSSGFFRKIFINKGSAQINIEDEISKNIIKEKIQWAYQVILNKFYKGNFSLVCLSVHPYQHLATGLEKFMELELDARFVEVKPKTNLPEMPSTFCIHGPEDILKIDELQEWLPLDMFEFEGMMLIRMKDVTEQQIINEIKNSLLTVNAFVEVENFEKLQAHIQNLIGKHGLKIGITPFFKINDHFVFSDMYEKISLLFGKTRALAEKHSIHQKFEIFFNSGNNVLLIPKVNKSSIREYSFLQHIYDDGGRSVFICPLMNEKELLGTLEIISETAEQLQQTLFSKIAPAIPLFTLSLEKSVKDLEARIDAVIKEKFTAIQAAVEWRFTEVAINYISEIKKDPDAKLENIVFENVYPLYGAIDIRNSSGERNQAIQQDLTEQLQAIINIIKKAGQAINSPLLDRIKERSEEYLYTIANAMHSDDEFEIHAFFKKDVKELFHNLRNRVPAMQPDIAEYFSTVDSNTTTWTLHRKEFEESITYVNDLIARFIDREQLKAQELFPHYFERFVTDGIDFNIYMGQSLNPKRIFTPADMQQLKMWQVNTLVRAAIFGKRLEKKTPVALQTTQLILAHNQPISISFRIAERKFDVDGAYNIRYEIIKKRIDKVHTKDGERLTQPGTLAVVYTQPDEASEYLGFFEPFQKEGLLKSDVQEFELEELQGVNGLKALRIGINLEEEENKLSISKPKMLTDQ